MAGKEIFGTRTQNINRTSLQKPFGFQAGRVRNRVGPDHDAFRGVDEEMLNAD